MKEKSMKVNLEKVEDLIIKDKQILLMDEELKVAKEILNTLNKNAESISSPSKILNFCKEALNYNPVSEFI